MNPKGERGETQNDSSTTNKRREWVEVCGTDQKRHRNLANERKKTRRPSFEKKGRERLKKRVVSNVDLLRYLEKGGKKLL